MALGPVDGDFLCPPFFDPINENRLKNTEDVELGDQADITTIGGPKKDRGSRSQTIPALQCANINAVETFTSCILEHLAWTYRVRSGINPHSIVHVSYAYGDSKYKSKLEIIRQFEIIKQNTDVKSAPGARWASCRTSVPTCAACPVPAR